MRAFRQSIGVAAVVLFPGAAFAEPSPPCPCVLPRAPPSGYSMGEYEPVDPPVAYGPPPVYYYGYRPYYRPWGWRRRYW
jgi:hypothetical protein